MSARAEIAAQITQDNPAYKVLQYPFTPASVPAGQVIVSLWRADVNPAPNDHLAHEVTINVYGSKTVNAAAETELDGAFDSVMLALQRIPSAIFKTASRQTFDEVIAGWQITVTLVSTNPYKQAILKGQ